MDKKISLIVAVSENGVIGDNNQLLWHLPNDLKHFKALTLNKPIIMGRKTYGSIGKPLPQRQNIILTHQSNLTIPGCDVVHTVEQALAVAQTCPEIMVIGGGEIYRLFYPLATCIYMTQVHTQIKGEVHFMDMDLEQWQETAREFHARDEKHLYDYSFVTYTLRR